ncbi:MAG TPA: nuclear transport factor 2 family protein [Terriglobales bacterium]|jgi:ketosteroid isomerase-like protein
MFSARSMIRLLLAFCLSVATILAHSQAAPSNASRAEDQVAQLEHDWLTADAHGDTDRLRQIIADDFIGTSFNGTVLNKDDIIPEGTAPGGFAGAASGETSIRVFGDTAVLMGVILKPGQPQANQLHVTLVCQKRLQGWKIIAAQLTQ